MLALGAALCAGAQTPPPKPGTQPPPKPAAAPAKTPAPAPAQAPAPAKSSTAAKPVPAAKPAAHAPAPAPPKPKAASTQAPPAKKPAPKPAKKEAAAPEKKEEAAPEPVASTHRRDPFLALLTATTGPGVPIHLPQGQAGLQVSTLRVEGVVRSPNGMLAVISSPQGRVYFLHQGARVFDGQIEQINMDSVTFQESGKDPFGHSIDRTVVKRIYQTAGELQ